eukprot:4945629-Prorocentrum_lima.AAC.1
MTSSLVGSEMCIRDSTDSVLYTMFGSGARKLTKQFACESRSSSTPHMHCLLYTSDAADDM